MLFPITSSTHDTFNDLEKPSLPEHTLLYQALRDFGPPTGIIAAVRGCVRRERIVPPDGVDVVQCQFQVPLVVGGHLLVDAEGHQARNAELFGVCHRPG